FLKTIADNFEKSVIELADYCANVENEKKTKSDMTAEISDDDFAFINSLM
ncbi:MAG: hypothetical protein GX567_06895, partial [Clostridia bacterium]|nr:hypothetical protein [Clostridia bacterium]